jgi:F-type H+-transporting ATPase subunit b
VEFLTPETARQLLLVMAVFWVAYWLLRIFLFGPVFDLLEERKEDVRSAEEVYRAALAETEAELDRQRSKLAGVRAQARDRRDQLRREAQSQRQELVARAKEQAESQLTVAQAELDRQVAGARSELEKSAQSLAERMTDRLLGRAS